MRRGLAGLIVLMLFAACVPNDPASYEAAAAGMRQATQEAIGLMGVEAQYTEQARYADATATQAAVTLQVSSARATMEMAAAQRAANAQALDNARATATLGAAHTEIAAQPIRAAATATRQAEILLRNQSAEMGLTLAAALLLIAATVALIWLIVELTKALTINIRARASERIARAMRASLVETTDGLKYLDTETGQVCNVQIVDYTDPPAEPVPHPSEVASAAPAPRKSSPTIGDLEMFVTRAIRSAGSGRGDYIPRHDAMGVSGAFWTARMDRLEALGFIPRRQQGIRNTLWAKQNLNTLLAVVRDYERAQRAAPSPESR